MLDDPSEATNLSYDNLGLVDIRSILVSNKLYILHLSTIMYN